MANPNFATRAKAALNKLPAELSEEQAQASSVIGLWLDFREQERLEWHERVARQWPLIPHPRPPAGRARPTESALGEPIARTKRALRNFWRWFGDSCVVDEHGRPFAMYVAGTDLLGPLIELNGPGVGYCFGWLPSAFRNALGAADTHGGKPFVTAAYFKLVKPAILNRGELPDGRSIKDMTAAEKVAGAEFGRQFGFDGAINSFEGVFLRGAVLDSYQVKAVDNSGGFDPHNADIYA